MDLTLTSSQLDLTTESDSLFDIFAPKWFVIFLFICYVDTCSYASPRLIFHCCQENDSDLDKERLANIVESVSGKYSSNLDISLDDSCQQLLLDYLNEVTLAALEQAALLAQHRGSFIVEEEDVQLVLGMSCHCHNAFYSQTICISGAEIYNYILCNLRINSNET